MNMNAIDSEVRFARMFLTSTVVLMLAGVVGFVVAL